MVIHLNNVKIKEERIEKIYLKILLTMSMLLKKTLNLKIIELPEMNIMIKKISLFLSINT